MIGFNRKEESSDLHWDEQNKKIDESTHLAFISKTSGGKTRRLLGALRHYMSDQKGVLVFDVKNIIDRDILTIVDKDRVFKLGVDSAGKHAIKINLFSHITQSEQNIQRFSKALLSSEAYSDHKFWAQSSELILSTSLSLLSYMNKCLIHVSTIIDREIEFERTIRYDEDKEVIFSLSSNPLTFAEFYEKISHRETFRQTAGNIQVIVDKFFEEIKGYLDFNTLNKEDALTLDMYMYKIERFAKLFSTYQLPSKEDFSGTSGSYFGLLMGTPQILYTDTTLNSKEDTHDVCDLLEKGNCVIVSTNNLQVQSFLFNIYAEHFSLRASLPDANEVVIALDEANSLLNTGTSIDMEHVVTYARSSRLKLIALFQSEKQLYKAFGTFSAETILENFTKITMVNKENRDTDYLYYRVEDDEKVIKFDPLFKTKSEQYAAIRDFQLNTHDFPSIKRKDTEIVLFDHAVYDKRKEVTVVDIDTMKSRNVKYIIDEDKYYGHFMNRHGYIGDKEKTSFLSMEDIEKAANDILMNIKQDPLLKSS